MTRLRYVGHPFIDVGVATIVAFAKKQRPEDVTDTDLEEVVAYLTDVYLNQTMAKYVGYVVFANIYFGNPGLVGNPKYDLARREALIKYLSLYKPGVELPDKEEAPDPGESCIFSGDPAVIRASRTLIPMSSVNINFAPQGRPRFPIAGWCVLALMAMPLGALNSGGRMCLLHTFDPATLHHFAAGNLKKNRQMFHMNIEKLPNYQFAKTHFIQTLVEGQLQKELDGRAVPLNVFVFTSSSQNAHVDIFHLPSNIVRFIFEAQSSQYQKAWQAIQQRAWAIDPPSEDKDGIVVHADRNYFYEDLFDLPRNAPTFLRRYFLRQPLKGKPSAKQKQDPRYAHSFVKEREVIHWGITALFLERVLHMEKQRLDSIKSLADRIADYIIETNDGKLFNRLYLAKGPNALRLEFQRAAKNANRAKQPLVPYEEFIAAFFYTDDEGNVREDWWLARDLFTIRLIERLHQDFWTEDAQDDLIELDEKEEYGNS